MPRVFLLCLKEVRFEKSPYFMRHLHKNNVMLIPKFQNKGYYAS